jgi:phenylalanyl-tRNA synthetase beta chain
MYISFNWLKTLVDFQANHSELAEALTRVGLAVEGISAFDEDWILDIDLTSNRPDCLSHLGIAREIAVIYGSSLKQPVETESINVDEVPFPAILAPDIVKIEDSDLCHRFTGRIVRGVEIGPSPEWLVRRLESIGERSINNVADITNYVMHELGQPMHAFDLDRLSGQRIVVRRAKKGEKIVTLDGVERELESEMLAICDAEKPVAVAGIMGGLESSITDKTTNVFLEVAYFRRDSIRRTSRRLGLSTEASYRFERGVDIENLIRASNRAAELIESIAGGSPGDIIDLYPVKPERTIISVPDISASVERLTGLKVTTDESNKILEALGIHLTEPGSYESPTWRYDLAIEEDLVEEVARHYGYEKISSEIAMGHQAGQYRTGEERKRMMRQTLVEYGCREAITYSFIDTRYDALCDPIPSVAARLADAGPVTLRDAVIEGAVRMRPTLLPGLLDAVRLNLNHQKNDLKLFEIGTVFAAGRTGELPFERESFAMVFTGGEVLAGRAEPVRNLDFFDLKGVLEAAMESISVPPLRFIETETRHLMPGQTAAIWLGSDKIGYIGRISREIASDYKFKKPVYAVEIDLAAVLQAKSERCIYRPLPRYPSVIRDVSFLVSPDLTLDRFNKSASHSRPAILRHVDFVDIFEGSGIPEGMRSLTMRFEYRSDERTLTEEDVAAAHEAFIRGIESELGIKRRV